MERRRNDFEPAHLTEMFAAPTAFKVNISANDKRIFPWNEPVPGSEAFWKISVSPLNALQCLKDKPDIPIHKINEIHNEALFLITKLLNFPSICSDLTIQKLKLTEESFEPFMKSVENSQNLVKLFLWHCNLGEVTGNFFESAFSVNKRIKLLDLSNCNVNDDGAIGLGKALQKNDTLRKLNLHRNKIKDKGGYEIGNALKKNKTLFTLILSDNLISEIGCEEICKGLEKNRNLGFLNMSKNFIQNEGANFFSKAIESNRGLLELNLKSCGIEKEGLLSLWKSLNLNSTLLNFEFIEGNIKVGNEINQVEEENRNTEEDRNTSTGLGFSVSEMRNNIKKRIEQNKLKQKKLFQSALKLNQSAPWGRTRLLFIGQGRAGKTATVRALLREPFQEQHDSTIGANLTQLSTRADNEKGWAKSTESEDFTSRHAARILAEKHFELDLVEGNVKKNNREAEKSKLSKNIVVSVSKEKRLFKPYRKVLSQKKMFNPSVPGFEMNKVRRYSLPGNTDVDILNEEEKEKEKEKERENDRIGVGELVGFNIDEFMKKPFEQTLAFRSRQDKDALNFTLWDFGGQEVFYSMHHLFLSSHGLYFLVFNCLEILDFISEDFNFSSENENRIDPCKYLKFWLNSVSIHAPNTSVFLVGSHVDKLEGSSKDLNKINEFLLPFIKKNEKFIKIIENKQEGFCFFPVDNKNLVGIHDLQLIIEKEARLQGHVKTRVPIRWMACLDELMKKSNSKSQNLVKKPRNLNLRTFGDMEAFDKDFEKSEEGVDGCWLSLKEVKKVSKKFEIIDSDEVENMLKTFNELGVLIYLTSTSTLKEKVILKPQWLLDVLGKVIRDKNIHEHKFKSNALKLNLTKDIEQAFEEAIFSRDLLEILWQNEDIHFLIELMSQTMLISKWDFSKDLERKYLVPSLLKNQPMLENKPKTRDTTLKSLGKFLRKMTTKEKGTENGKQFEVIFDFSERYLPIGVFERLICILVSYDALNYLLSREFVKNENKESFLSFKKPLIFKNYCQLSLNKENTFQIRMNQDIEDLKIKLQVYYEEEIEEKTLINVCKKSLQLVKDALNKVNLEVMRNNLKWKLFFRDENNQRQKSHPGVVNENELEEIKLENEEDEKIMSEDEAKKYEIYPWFEMRKASEHSVDDLEFLESSFNDFEQI